MIGNLAIIGTPFHWILVAVIAVALFAPKLIPVIARMLGRHVGREIHRRYGIRLAAPRPTPRSAPHDRPAPPRPPERQEPAPQEQPAPSSPALMTPLPANRNRSAMDVWAVPAVVAGAAAVLLWVLLHGR